MWTITDSPIGPLRVVARDGAVTAIEFSPFRDELAAGAEPLGDRDDHDPLLQEAVRQLIAYFARELKEFDVRLSVVGTPFQQRVWAGLAEIPYGESWSYAELAEHIGAPRAMRAVGLANGKNPVSIVVPCHRVVGSNGSLTGYGGGLARKQLLLDLERGA